MKKLILLTSLLVTTAAFADDGSGYIVGFDGGQAEIKYKPNSYAAYINDYTAPATEVNNAKGFAYDAYFGYKLYREFGWELGYYKYTTTDYQYNSTPNSMRVKRYDYDLLMRGSYPLGKSGFDIFAKLGAAYTNNRFETGTGQGTNVMAWTPAYGLGISYNVTDSIGLNTQWLHTNKVKPNAHTANNNAPDVPTVNYLSAGMVYRF